MFLVHEGCGQFRLLKRKPVLDVFFNFGNLHICVYLQRIRTRTCYFKHLFSVWYRLHQWRVLHWWRACWRRTSLDLRTTISASTASTATEGKAMVFRWHLQGRLQTFRAAVLGPCLFATGGNNQAGATALCIDVKATKTRLCCRKNTYTYNILSLTVLLILVLFKQFCKKKLSCPEAHVYVTYFFQLSSINLCLRRLVSRQEKTVSVKKAILRCSYSWWALFPFSDYREDNPADGWGAAGWGFCYGFRSRLVIVWINERYLIYLNFG